MASTLPLPQPAGRAEEALVDALRRLAPGAAGLERALTGALADAQDEDPRGAVADGPARRPRRRRHRRSPYSAGSGAIRAVSRWARSAAGAGARRARHHAALHASGARRSRTPATAAISSSSRRRRRARRSATTVPCSTRCCAIRRRARSICFRPRRWRRISSPSCMAWSSRSPAIEDEPWVDRAADRRVHLRRRHAAGRAARDSLARARRAQQSRHAALRASCRTIRAGRGSSRTFATS